MYDDYPLPWATLFCLESKIKPHFHDGVKLQKGNTTAGTNHLLQDFGHQPHGKHHHHHHLTKIQHLVEHRKKKKKNSSGFGVGTS
jgi:hypothetical protein